MHSLVKSREESDRFQLLNGEWGGPVLWEYLGLAGKILWERFRCKPIWPSEGSGRVAVLWLRLSLIHIWYTDHSQKHAVIVAERAAGVLEVLGYSKKEIELCKIAGFMHDIGNCVNRSDHAHSGAIMAMQILRSLGMSAEDISVVISAIGNHDEKTGTAVNAVSAARCV